MVGIFQFRFGSTVTIRTKLSQSMLGWHFIRNFMAGACMLQTQTTSKRSNWWCMIGLHRRIVRLRILFPCIVYTEASKNHSIALVK